MIEIRHSHEKCEESNIELKIVRPLMVNRTFPIEINAQ